MRRRKGIMIGRFQPLHLGHQLILHHIMQDGLDPVVFIGSVNVLNEKNPLSYWSRLALFEEVYGADQFPIHPLEDTPCWDSWWAQVENALGEDLEDAVLYYYNKPGDEHESFTFRGKHYTDAHYTECLPIQKKQSTYPDIVGIKISASDIRADLDKHKAFLHPKVYHFVKNKLRK